MVYKKLIEFKKKYPATISWRLEKHAEVIEKHLNPGENVLYAFAAQKNEFISQIFHTYAVVLTNKRILLAEKRLLFGYLLVTITPDMFNDITVYKGVIWGGITIDTIKERVVLTNISPKALPEIESIISDYMMEEKKKYAKNDDK